MRETTTTGEQAALLRELAALKRGQAIIMEGMERLDLTSAIERTKREAAMLDALAADLEATP